MILAIILMVGTLLISLAAAARVKGMFAKYSKLKTRAGYTGAEAAAAILQAAGIGNVQIIEHPSILGDHYDPIHKRLVLSTDVYHGTSAAALGVAAHECGHAIQDKVHYAPLKIRMAAVGATTFANQVVMWLPLLGIFFMGLNPWIAGWIMAVGWGVIMLFNLVTLPVEFDASNRAKVILGKMGFIQPGEETEGVNKVLNAAALTYVAAFITSLLYFLWYLLPLLFGGRRDE
ncbi:MAG: zinc metallopeptidase [Verrucomicrobiota bacterium]|nr:zinc metallopeptidase [Verrucomicrobiota bacterium]